MRRCRSSREDIAVDGDDDYYIDGYDDDDDDVVVVVYVQTMLLWCYFT